MLYYFQDIFPLTYTGCLQYLQKFCRPKVKSQIKIQGHKVSIHQLRKLKGGGAYQHFLTFTYKGERKTLGKELYVIYRRPRKPR